MLDRLEYKVFFQSSRFFSFQACGGYGIIFLLVFAIFCFAMARLFVSIWLQIWVDAGDGSEIDVMMTENSSTSQYFTNITVTKDQIASSQNITNNPNLWYYQLVHGISLIVMITIGLVKGILIAHRLLIGSHVLHQAMLERVIKAPMSFFDKTPAGRILNRFSKDMDEGVYKNRFL